MNKGKIIVLEGLDGCGKATQFEKLAKFFDAADIPYLSIDFPRYGNRSSSCVEQYLAGMYGTEPDSVNPYVCSTFYDVDRCASYLDDWGEWYENGGLVLCNRYTTSNAIYQAAKLPDDKWPDFWNWLYEFEYEKLGLPEPDIVLYLDMPVEQSINLVKQRNSGADILERDIEYQKKCYAAAQKAIDYWGWEVIHCTQGNWLRTKTDIHKDIEAVVSGFLAGELND